MLVTSKKLCSVVMVLAFGTQGHWFEFCPNLKFLPCIYSFVSLVQTVYVRHGPNEVIVDKGRNVGY